ncbi:unnamed protein product, partial [Owenia fusiformis]
NHSDMQLTYVHGLAILSLFCLTIAKRKCKRPREGDQSSGHRAIQADIGKLKDAVELLIKSHVAMTTDLKHDSTSIHDEVSNLRNDVSNMKASLTDLRDGDSATNFASIRYVMTRDDVANLMNILSDLRDNDSVTVTELKHKLREHLTGIAVKEDNNTKTVVTDNSEVCNKSSAMFQAIQDQLTDCKYNRPESDNHVSSVYEDPIMDDPLPGSEDWTHYSDGVHNITTRTGTRFRARCEAGWLIIVYRFNGSVDFNLDWGSYKHGFGNIFGEHFLGMENIVSVLQQKRYKARFELTSWENETKYAEYKDFDLNDEKSNYRLDIDGYSGTAGDSMHTPSQKQFITKDSHDRTGSRCAASYGPFWYGCSCNARASLFGKHAPGPKCTFAYGCISWTHWPDKLSGVTSNGFYSFKEVKLKIRPG